MIKWIRVLAVLCGALLCSCNSVNNDKTAQAKNLALKHARLLDVYMSDNDQDKIQQLLLTVRAKEHEIRSNGYTSEADAYITTFEQSVWLSSDSLAQIIF